MCFICCCSSHRGISFSAARWAAIITGIEAVAFFICNLLLILLYTCDIVPTRNNGATFIHEIRTWFFYDNENCLEKVGNTYIEPSWIQYNELVFDTLLIKNGVSGKSVDSKNNFGYQVTYLVFHALWFLSCLQLLFGTMTKKTIHFYPWLIISAFMIVFDIVIASLYIAFWAETNPGWEEGSAFFSMIFFYLRAFLFEILNIMFFCRVASAMSMARRMSRRPVINQQQQQPPIHIHMNTTVQEVPNAQYDRRTNLSTIGSSEGNSAMLPRVTLEPPKYNDNPGFISDSKARMPADISDSTISIPRAGISKLSTASTGF